MAKETRRVERRKGDLPPISPASAEERRAPAEPGTPPEDVAARAYELYERRGGDHGRDLDDWLEAERQLGVRPPLQRFGS